MRLPAMTRSEWLYASCLALLVLVITGVPYLVGWATSGPSRVFEGFVFDVQDIHSHLAKMQQGYRGEWQYRILFTPEPHPGAYVNTFYIGLGHLARLLGLNLVATYHLARLFFGFFLLIVSYVFAAFFLDKAADRRLAYFLICFSSGLGWLALLVCGSFVTGDITPVDFWFIEMYTFFCVMVFPHTCLALALLLMTFGLIVYHIEGAGWSVVAGAALCAVLVCLIHPYTLLVIDLVVAAYWLVAVLRRRITFGSRLPGLLVLGLVPLPLAFYQYTAISSNPVFAAWQVQSTTFSPPSWHYVLGYGVLLALAIPGGWWALKQEARWPLLPLWLLIVTPLLYAPVVFNLQRRMIEGAHVPLCILATVGMTFYVLPAVGRSRLARFLAAHGYPAARLKLLVRNLLVALTLPSTLFLILSASLAAAAGQPDLVHSASEIAGVDWLAVHTTPEDTILALYDLGGFIPGRIGRRVFIGHWAETLDVENKQAAAARFFGNANDAEHRALLDRYDITYVFFGPRERSPGGFEPGLADYLSLEYRHQDVDIYRVVTAR
jgi:hypothetical protein